MRYSNGDFNFTNAWFKWQFLAFIVRAMVAGLVGGFIVVGLAVATWAPQFIEAYVYAVLVGLVLLIAALVICFVAAVFRALFGRPRPPRQPAEWMRNPPAPWWDSDGNMLWERSGNGWQPIQRHQQSGTI